MKIKWSPLSIDRVTEIALYIATDKVSAADKWIDSIFSAVEKLSKFPQSGRIVPEFKKENIRELIHGNYRIIYQVSQSEIEILTVRHGKQLLEDNDILK
ncbi:MAG: type II toxin-antitoxin system RelE/ParE family toxin [Calditrichaceae bacterium]|nr:type II toxin-antitoxin system RelE/ParE family toxin [Calditrichaceae bacterium]MBN2708160.1 type II toxin-antitoxin system RelE/ParE family toxin [Calditrichaceae bacterium]RQV97158.1 MAG: type II toxin-antitoxin system RelE/ParE family toxin [Calditrichota bacterium]